MNSVECRLLYYKQLNATEIYRHSRNEIWDWAPTQESSYISVAAVIAISFKKIKHLESNTVRLFCLLAFLAADNVPEYIWTSDPEFSDEILRNAFSTRSQLNKTLQSLLVYHFVKRFAHGMLSIHRLLQAVMKYHSRLVRSWKSRSVSKPRQTTDLLG